MSVIKVGVSGYGLSGGVFHCPLIMADARYRICAIQTSQPSKVNLAIHDLIICKTIDELCALELDLIVVAVPNYLHEEYVVKALSAGKHVVVEKPFAVTSKQALRMIDTAKVKNKILTVFQNRRWDGDFLTAKSTIKSNLLGSLSQFELHFDRFRVDVGTRWKEQDFPGGGVLYDLGAHLIDQAIQLFGKPKRVFADIACQRIGSVQPDYFHVLFDYGTFRGILHASTLTSIQGPKIQIHGSHGSYVKYGLDPQEDQLRSGLSPQHADFGKDMESNYGDLLLINNSAKVEKAPTIRGQYSEFYSRLGGAILFGDQLPVDPIEACEVIRIIELLATSAQEARWLDA